MKKKTKQNISWQDKAANRIAGRIISVQLFISHRLQKLEQRLTVKQKKAGLFVFCLFGSIYLLYLLGSALFFKQPPRYHDFLPGQERTISPSDSGHFPHASQKQFIYHKNHRQ